MSHVHMFGSLVQQPLLFLDFLPSAEVSNWQRQNPA